MAGATSTNDVNAYLANSGNTSPGSIYLCIYDGAAFDCSTTSQTTWLANTWYHAEFIYSTTAGSSIYINGKLDGTNSSTGRGVVTSDTLRVNSRYDGNYPLTDPAASPPFSGIIDDVKIYNYARTPAQVAWDNNNGKPYAWYRLDECSGTTIYDSSGNGINGTLTIGGSGTQTAVGSCLNTPTPGAWENGITGKINSGMSFDGTDDYISITNTSAIDQNEGLSSGISASVWIYATAAGEGNGGRVFTKNTHTWCRTDTLSGSNLDVECSVDLGTDATLNISAPITINTWNHIVLTWTDDGDDELSIFVNGQLKGNSTNGVGPTSADTANLIIGNDTSSATQTFAGKIDDFRLFNYELTTQQVKDIYNNGSVSFR